MTDGKKPETPRVDAYVAAQPDEKDMHELCESYNGLLYLARELEQALALRGEPVADKLTELAEQVLEVADYLNDACNNAGEIAGSECVDPLMSIHGDLLGLLAAPISGERVREALDELDWIIDQERYTFAECSLAEEIMARVKRVRNAIHGEKNG